MRRRLKPISRLALVDGYRALGRSWIALLPKAIVLLARTAIAFLVVGLKHRSPTARLHLFGAFGTVAFCISVTIGYIALVPKVYASKWTLILPTAASNVDLRVENVGHAQTVASSPFGSASLSPKVIYKEIITSEQVKLAAATVVGILPAKFGAPRVKLVDETALMFLEIRGRTPDQAQHKARAINTAFSGALDVLRKDEVRRRADVVKDSLGLYQSNLETARQRISEHQAQTGVLSMNQFHEIATSLEQLRRRLSDVRTEMERLATEQALLSARFGIEPAAAAAVVQLSGDPTFAKLTLELAEAEGALRADARRLGEAHPTSINLRQRFETVTTELQAHLAQYVPDFTHEKRRLLVGNGTQSSDMLRLLIATNLTFLGKKAEYAVLDAEYIKLSATVAKMSKDIARLDDLKKDHLVAEAVFTSAVGRLNTNQTDIYASYPMVQMLAEPDLPEETANPSTMLIVSLGIFASLLGIAGWTTSWLRHTFNQKQRKRS